MSKQQPLYESMDELLADDPKLPALITEIQTLYLEDEKPWVIGFSGGKDSTTILSLIYVALTKLKKAQRHKHIYVISSDTLVETPMVVNMVTTTIEQINAQAKKQGLPLSAHIVLPKMDQTFWANLLGKGYPAPTQSFRWCTERMKIDPVSEFILDKVARFGEVVVVLGARKQEGGNRKGNIEGKEVRDKDGKLKKAAREIKGSRFNRHSTLTGALTYTPVEDWTHDDVWMYLLGAPAPWGGDHFELFHLYKDSTEDGECPLVTDTSTPSCGNSRFGCWTCTVVTKDRAIEGLIESGNGNEWLIELKKFRNKLYKSTLPENKSEYRNYKRRTGKVQYARKAINDDSDSLIKTIPGPYWMKQRKEWLKELLSIEKKLNDQGIAISLIQAEELYAIRREWMFDPNEPDWADTLPQIYREVYGTDLDWADQDSGAFTQTDADLLKELENQHEVPFELAMKLIELELSMDGLSRRKGLYQKMGTLLNRDWGSLEDIKIKMDANTHKPQLKALELGYNEKLEELAAEYEKLAK
ncbi:DNA phosphorothioation system sulfurtransferase DndC [Halieaceae bacterium IMCC14734]|uniref:DNA phosphorothioation system sulfurtransferase DndC n=1 Tax=Candidatus Litorirhabdus singularis TaxID=2518993 RepID=A0ABT3TNJ3_9GAMM|nr:DNA phosphorothioation system sulfurtransferase DndC [Candidatus Litorirhabdus singularis]MCX2982877.1 DNA phosphorothioation system sulfurtransferase DndC [Candidatus Litorirhabdus singularis]